MKSLAMRSRERPAGAHATRDIGVRSMLSHSRERRMRQVACYGDERNKGFCVHCGGPDETRDHAPSKILLDDPLPDNLPVAPACYRCNNGFSRDEEYLACLLECVMTGEAEPDKVERPKVAHILRENRNLAMRLRKSRRVVDGQIVWDIESDRVRNVLLKLARGHPHWWAPDQPGRRVAAVEHCAAGDANRRRLSPRLSRQQSHGSRGTLTAVQRLVEHSPNKDSQT